MIELECRIGTPETAFTEAFAWFEAQVVDDAIAGLRAGLVTAADNADRTQRLGALKLLPGRTGQVQGLGACRRPAVGLTVWSLANAPRQGRGPRGTRPGDLAGNATGRKMRNA